MKIIALRSLSQKTGDWSPLINYLEDNYKKSTNPSYLYECCKIKAYLDEWEYVAKRALELNKEFKTPDVIRLTTIAAHKTSRYDLCLKLLDDNLELFPNKNFPANSEGYAVIVSIL